MLIRSSHLRAVRDITPAPLFVYFLSKVEQSGDIITSGADKQRDHSRILPPKYQVGLRDIVGRTLRRLEFGPLVIHTVLVHNHACNLSTGIPNDSELRVPLFQVKLRAGQCPEFKLWLPS